MSDSYLVIALVGLLLIGSVVWGAFQYRSGLSKQLVMQTNELARLQSRYRALFECSPEPIFLVDPHSDSNAWVIEDINAQVEVLLGYEQQMLAGRSVDDLFLNPPSVDDRAWYLEELRRNPPLSFESILRHRSGSVLPMELSSVLLIDQGRELILVIGRDVRHRSQVQTLQDDYEQTVLMLNQIAVDITSTLHVDEIMRRLVQAAHQVFPQSLAATVQLLNEAGDQMMTVYASEGAAQTPKKVVFRPGVGISGLAVAEKKVINVGDIESDPRFVPGALPPAFKSLLVAPLVSSSRIWGTLSIEGVAANGFSKRDERMANMLARQAGAALENAYLYETAQRQREIADTLRDIGIVLTSSLNQQEVLQQLVQQVGRVLHYDAASIWMNRPDGSYFRFVGVGYEKYEPGDTPLAEWPPGTRTALHLVGETREVQIIPDVRRSALWHGADRDLWIRSWAGAPIIVRGELSGVFCLDHEQPNFYSTRQREVLEAFAAQVSIAIENAFLFEQVQNYALNLQQEVATQTAEIRSQQERTEAILSNIEDAVITFDARGIITYANEATQALLGWKLNEMLGRSVLQYVHRNTPRRVQQEMVHAARRRESWRGELFVQHSLGYPILIDLAAVPYMVADGESAGFISSMRILSDERVIERMKAQFMTLVSHELRTPLTNLKLHLHLLRKAITGAGNAERYLDVLDEQTRRLAVMMEKVLAVIRLTDHEALSYHTQLSFETLLDSIAVRYRDQMAAKQINLSVKTIPYPDIPVVYGDEHWVALACYELVENALAYTPEQGDITITLEEFSEHDIRFLGLSVRDNGVGIDERELRELNTAFTRLGDQRKGDTAGIGLGLFIARSVGEQLGGGLKVESELGVGSCFTLYFPVKA